MNTMTDCPTFIDLRALAGAGAALEGTDPFDAVRPVAVSAGECEVFFIDLPAGHGTATEARGDAWLFALSGAVVFESMGGDLTLAEGESCGAPRGTSFGWRTDAPATLLAMRYPGGNAGMAPGIVAIPNDAPLSASNPPALDVLLSDVPSCRSNNLFVSADAVFKCGIWDSTPYQRVPIFFHHSELMHLLEGSVSFVDKAGRAATFHKGDTFIIEQGAECSWDSQVKVAKIYAYYKPAA